MPKSTGSDFSILTDTVPSANKTKVFISYSREDREFADKLSTRLADEENLHVHRDTFDVLPAEEWRERLHDLILNSDTIIFCMSPHSVISETCLWEVDLAEQLNKRLVPIIVDEVAAEQVPDALARLNFIYFTANAKVGASGDFEQSLNLLTHALQTNIQWIRDHTRLEVLAQRWAGNVLPKAQPLRGSELSAAENWLMERPARAPEITNLQRQYISFSRQSAKRRQRVFTGVALFVAGLAAFAYSQVREADNQRNRVIVESDNKLLRKSQFLASRASESINRGDAVTGTLLALEGLQHQDANERRPVATEAISALARSIAHSRERRVLADSGTVSVTRFSPDGKMLATGSLADTARLWNVKSGQQVADLGIHGGWVTDIAFSPDGSLMATAGAFNSRAYIWEVRNGAVRKTELKGHDSRITSLLFTADGNRVVTGSWDSTVRVFEARTGSELAVLQGHSNNVVQIAMSKDGELLVLASEDRTAHVWSMRDYKLVSVLRGHGEMVTHAAFDPAGVHVVTGSADKTLKVWNAKTGNNLKTLTGHRDRIKTIAFSPDGAFLASASNAGDMRLWNVSSWALEASINQDTAKVTTLAFDPRRALLVAGYRDGMIREWDYTNGRLVVAYGKHVGGIASISIDPGGSFVVTGSSDKTARLWTSGENDKPISIQGHRRGIRNLYWRSDSASILSSSYDQSVSFWDLSGEPLALSKGLKRGIFGFASSPDGNRLATAEWAKTILLWDFKTQRIIKRLSGHKEIPSRLAFSPDGKRLLSGPSSDIAIIGKRPDPPRLWDGNSGRLLAVLAGHKLPVRVFAFSTDGKRVATGSHDKSVRIWDSTSGALQVVLSGHSFPINAIGFNRDGDRLVTGSSDNTARIWDTSTGRTIKVLRGHVGPVFNAAYSPDGRWIATTGQQDGTTRVWSSDGFDLVATLQGGKMFAFSNSGQQITTVASKTLRLWESKSGKLLKRFPDHEPYIRALAISPNDRYLATASENGSIRIWSNLASTQRLIAKAKAALPRCLTEDQRVSSNLALEVPSWCFERQLWPYDTVTLVQKGSSALDKHQKQMAERLFQLAREYNPAAEALIKSARQKSASKVQINDRGFNRQVLPYNRN